MNDFILFTFCWPWIVALMTLIVVLIIKLHDLKYLD
jgi:hypothetical protein